MLAFLTASSFRGCLVSAAKQPNERTACRVVRKVPLEVARKAMHLIAAIVEFMVLVSKLELFLDILCICRCAFVKS